MRISKQQQNKISQTIQKLAPNYRNEKPSRSREHIPEQQAARLHYAHTKERLRFSQPAERGAKTQIV